MPKRPDYGIDAPGVLVTLVLIGVAGQILGLFAPPLKIGPVTIVFGVSMQIAGGIFLLQGVLMIVYVKWGKFRHRDRMLAQFPWTGNERVLDVGTGRGLLLIGAAKRRRRAARWASISGAPKTCPAMRPSARRQTSRWRA